MLFAFTRLVCQPDSHWITHVLFIEHTSTTIHPSNRKTFLATLCLCRYLKQVVDMLKHEKEWCFKMYDSNCDCYPQHCMKNVRSGSFPSTAILNENGNLHEEIHGFYPEPVLRTIFDKI